MTIMPNTSIQPDAATFPAGNCVRDARFVAVGQGAAIGIKSAGFPGRITIGGISSRVTIRVGVALP